MEPNENTNCCECGELDANNICTRFGWLCPDCVEKHFDELEAALAAEREQRAVLDVDLAATAKVVDKIRAERNAASVRASRAEADRETEHHLFRATENALVKTAEERDTAEDRFRRWMGALVETAWAHDVALYDDQPGAFVDKLEERFAAARAEAVREFAQHLDFKDSGIFKELPCEFFMDRASNYLAHLAEKEPPR